MTITLIASVARNRAIGNRGKLLYWLPEDMRRFRRLTTGHTIVMGRRTYESLPHGALPERRNCVLTTTVKELPGCECFASWEELRQTLRDDEQVYVIGGDMIYRALIGHATALAMTEVDDTPAEADAFFPDYSHGWRETARLCHPADDRHSHSFAFVDYVRE